jgi:hypothetical protein
LRSTEGGRAASSRKRTRSANRTDEIAGGVGGEGGSNAVTVADAAAAGELQTISAARPKASLRTLHGILDKYIAGTVEGVDGKVTA